MGVKEALVVDECESVPLGERELEKVVLSVTDVLGDDVRDGVPETEAETPVAFGDADALSEALVVQLAQGETDAESEPDADGE